MGIEGLWLSILLLLILLVGLFSMVTCLWSLNGICMGKGFLFEHILLSFYWAHTWFQGLHYEFILYKELVRLMLSLFLFYLALIFADSKNVVQSGLVTYPRLHSWYIVKPKYRSAAMWPWCSCSGMRLSKGMCSCPEHLAVCCPKLQRASWNSKLLL